MAAHEFPQNLRYSPVNWLIVDWGFNGAAFNNCGLPQPLPRPTPRPDRPAPCAPLLVREAIDTYDWERWLPEVIIGVDDPDEEIAANYVREAAIDFAKRSRVMQRQLLIPLQPGVCTYPVEPYEGEQIVGVIGASFGNGNPCGCTSACTGFLPNDVPYTLDIARNELHLGTGTNMNCCGEARTLQLLVWAAPAEDACFHDVFLYNNWRRDITLAARRNYVMALHFRDTALVRSLYSREEYEKAVALAKNKSMSRHSWSVSQPGSGMWQPAFRQPVRNFTGRQW